jgi:hypothetical protein
LQVLQSENSLLRLEKEKMSKEMQVGLTLYLNHAGKGPVSGLGAQPVERIGQDTSKGIAVVILENESLPLFVFC